MEEITAIIIGERIRKDLWCIARAQNLADVESQGAIVAPSFDISLECEPESLVPRLSYRFYGEWKETEKFGRQFKASTFVAAAPHGRAGVIRYLQQCPWIGQQIASRLFEKFAGDAVRILRESPEVAVAAVSSGAFPIAKAKEAAEFLEGEAALEGCSIDLMDVLDKRGFPKVTARKCVQAWGNRAAAIVRKNPYRLMRFRGCGFMKTDAMYIDLGHPAGAMKRQAYCAWHTVASDDEGNTWLHIDQVVAGLKMKIGGAEVNAPKALLLAKRGKLIASKRDRLGNIWIAEYGKARAEGTVAQRVAEMLADGVGQGAVEPLDVVQEVAA